MARARLDIEQQAPHEAQTGHPAGRDAKRLPFGSACVTRALPATRGRLQRDRGRRSSLRAVRKRLTARARPVQRRASRGLSRHALTSASLATSLPGAGTADQDTRRATTLASRSFHMEERIPLVVKAARLVGSRRAAPSPSAAGSAAHLLITSILYCSLPRASPSPNGLAFAWEARREPVWRPSLTIRRDLKRHQARGMHSGAGAHHTNGFLDQAPPRARHPWGDGWETASRRCLGPQTPCRTRYVLRSLRRAPGRYRSTSGPQILAGNHAQSAATSVTTRINRHR
jgi:hypothetical protein